MSHPSYPYFVTDSIGGCRFAIARVCGIGAAGMAYLGWRASHNPRVEDFHARLRASTCRLTRPVYPGRRRELNNVDVAVQAPECPLHSHIIVS